jgi:F1F0 ATPase subunit 2
LNSMWLALGAFATGGLLGTFFFIGLWWTVKTRLANRAPVLWFAGSLMVRTSLILAGFYLISAEGWQGLTPCVLGFFTARLTIVRCTTLPLNTNRAS